MGASQFIVDNIPYCKIHDSQYFHTAQNKYMCREAIENNCIARIMDKSDIDFLHDLAKIKAETLVRKHKTRR